MYVTGTYIYVCSQLVLSIIIVLITGIIFIANYLLIALIMTQL